MILRRCHRITTFNAFANKYNPKQKGRENPGPSTTRAMHVRLLFPLPHPALLIGEAGQLHAIFQMQLL